MSDKILRLKDIWLIENVHDYKVHFARWNGGWQPLDVWVGDREEWYGWQAYYPGRDDFNRNYIFTLMDFYHESDVWLFGGIFRVLGCHEDSKEPKGYRYEVELTDHGEAFIGRLKLRSGYKSRPPRVNFENHYDSFEVSEILREPYSGRAFPGYESIDIHFPELEALIRNDRPDWKSALENVQGVYMITDTSTGKRYVGSAYGDSGIWQRWAGYAASGHGWNKELVALTGDNGLGYAREKFRLALLEYCPARMPDEAVIARESFWKNALLTREYGLNLN